MYYGYNLMIRLCVRLLINTIGYAVETLSLSNIEEKIYLGIIWTSSIALGSLRKCSTIISC